MKNQWTRSLCYALLAYVAILVVLLGAEDHLIFYGARVDQSSLELRRANKDKVLFLKDGNDTIEYFKYVATPKTNKTILFLGGNAEDTFFMFGTLTKEFGQYNVLAINYPTYGLSTGKVDEESIYKKVNRVLAKEALSEIYLIGRSISSGVAVEMAKEHSTVKKLVLITPYNKLTDVACTTYPFIPTIVCDKLMKNKFDSESKIKTLNIPVDIIYAEGDEVVPNNLTEKLIKAYPNAHVLLIKNADHNNITESPEFKKELSSFVLN